MTKLTGPDKDIAKQKQKLQEDEDDEEATDNTTKRDIRARIKT